MSNETTTTGERHEPMVMERFSLLPGGGLGDYREETVCVSCWVGCDDETCIEPHGNAPWPCEVARLRERVAVLEGAADAAGAWMVLAVGIAEDRRVLSADLIADGKGIVKLLAAALAQADDGGRA